MVAPLLTLALVAPAAVKPPRALLQRSAYPHFEQRQTRWNDMDAFGHINNAVYYNYIDDAVNMHLARNGVSIDVQRFTSENSCRYLKQLAWPNAVDVGLPRRGARGR